MSVFNAEPSSEPEPPRYPPAGYPAPPGSPPPAGPPPGYGPWHDPYGGPGGSMPPYRARQSTWRRWVALAAAALLLFGGGLGLGRTLSYFLDRTHAVAGSVQLAPQPGSSGSSGHVNSGSVATKLSPSIVDVNTVTSNGFGQSGRGAGTGMIVTSSGIVLTNNHVIQGATQISVTVSGHSGAFNAHVLGADPTEDVAILQVDGLSGLPTVTFANTSDLKVGESVVAIGNALGQGGAPTVVEGSITALNRSITAADESGGSEQLTGMIQTDAPIQPGDSGGALANAAGQVVGMITAGTTQRFANAPNTTVGFAIPSSKTVDVINQVESGKAGSNVILGQPGYIGVAVRDPGAGSGNALGALVVGVVNGSPAERAGITQGAVITKVDGTSISSASTLGPAIRKHKPGDTINVTWTDQGGTHSANVTLTTGPAV